VSRLELKYLGDFLLYWPQRPKFKSAKVFPKTGFVMWKVRDRCHLRGLKFWPQEWVLSPSPLSLYNLRGGMRNSNLFGSASVPMSK
jgi:hypothetical protein